jgi:hypothetical protein
VCERGIKEKFIGALEENMFFTNLYNISCGKIVTCFKKDLASKKHVNSNGPPTQHQEKTIYFSYVCTSKHTSYF